MENSKREIIQQILVQLAKQTAQTASKEQAIQEIRQISSQVAMYPSGTISQYHNHYPTLQNKQPFKNDRSSSINNVFIVYYIVCYLYRKPNEVIL